MKNRSIVRVHITIDIHIFLHETSFLISQKRERTSLCFQIMTNADEFCQFARLGQTSKIQKCLQTHSESFQKSNRIRIYRSLRCQCQCIEFVR